MTRRQARNHIPLAAALLTLAGCAPAYTVEQAAAGDAAAAAAPPSTAVDSAPAPASSHASAAPVRAGDRATAQEKTVLPGLEVLLRDSAHLVRGRRVGFVTNQTAITSTGESGIDLLHASPDVRLVALFGPEHGLRGGVEGGVKIESGVDARTGVPVHSLYGATQRPTPEMLRGVDVLLFDMQDIGARPYTFVWTMAMAMEAAAAEGIPFIVLDRPNPITSRMEGPLMRPEMRNVGQAITGYYPVPLRHGMTVGEIARYINGEYGVGADLTVIPAAGWAGDMWFDETGLPWIDPSPNIRSLDAALTYSGLVLAEATNLTVGRGTDAPFSTLGAPWLDAAQLLERVHTYEMPGVVLDTTSYVPRGTGWVPFRDQRVRAVRFRITDRDAFQPVWMTLVLLSEIRRSHPTEFRITNDGFTQMLGSHRAREAFDSGVAPAEIWQRWAAELEAWRPVRERYRLY
ncbi:MAG: exo-beta-N-acetylmuramidase NamZ family protein [Longimicrobiales bacterium]